MSSSAKKNAPANTALSPFNLGSLPPHTFEARYRRLPEAPQPRPPAVASALVLIRYLAIPAAAVRW